VHYPQFSAEELVINPQDFPSVKVGDIFEIQLAQAAKDDLQSKSLLLRVPSISPIKGTCAHSGTCMCVDCMQFTDHEL
jgi:hypothetical protein